jgi:hypothetical protein
MAPHGRREIVSTERTQEVAWGSRENIGGEMVDAKVGRARRAVHDTVVRARTQPIEQLEIREIIEATTRAHSQRRVGLRSTAQQSKQREKSFILPSSFLHRERPDSFGALSMIEAGRASEITVRSP